MLDLGYVRLAVFAVIFSLVGAFYYVPVMKLMCFGAPVETAAITPKREVKLRLGTPWAPNREHGVSRGSPTLSRWRAAGVRPICSRSRAAAEEVSHA